MLGAQTTAPGQQQLYPQLTVAKGLAMKCQDVCQLPTLHQLYPGFGALGVHTPAWWIQGQCIPSILYIQRLTTSLTWQRPTDDQGFWSHSHHQGFERHLGPQVVAEGSGCAGRNIPEKNNL